MERAWKKLLVLDQQAPLFELAAFDCILLVGGRRSVGSKSLPCSVCVCTPLEAVVTCLVQHLPAVLLPEGRAQAMFG